MLSKEHRKALRHIVNKGDDTQLCSKKWKKIKSELYHLGYLRRRVPGWDWIPTKKAIMEKYNV